jgi:hypothetical protein
VTRRLSIVALLLGLGACHLALGLERAEPIEEGGSAPSECTADGDCDDANPCTTDRCDAGSCVADLLDGEAAPELQTAGDCRLATCAQGQLASTTDAADLPVDGLSCSDDLCNGDVPSNPPLAGGTSCDDNGGAVCDGNGLCVECFSNADCVEPEVCNGGGTIGACGCTPMTTCLTLGLTCGGGGTDECNQPIVCSNGVKDGDETDVDCGGPQPMLGGTCANLCPTGMACVANTDCVSNLCTNLVCE